MKVLVLGAGVIGVTSAWYLQRAGHEVTVLDRQADVGMETSFANGGQISVSYSEPWANPDAPKKILQWLGKEDAPLLFRLRADWQQWCWGMQFLLECLPSRTKHNTIQCLNLSLYSRQQLQALRAETSLQYDHLERGILQFYTDQQEFDYAIKAAELMRQYGCDRVVKTTAECLAIEPALQSCRDKMVGGIYTASDETGDALKFTQQLSRLAEQHGVKFRYRVNVTSLIEEAGRISGARVIDAEKRVSTLTADAYVVALGCYSSFLLRPIGVPVLLYPAKGYSATIPVGPHHTAPTVSLTDLGYKIVFSRLGDRLRVAGTAELNGYDLSLNLVRCEALVKRTFELFPEAGERDAVDYWTGLRPATPSNVPLIGKTRYKNLYLNTGHGTLGWTMACGSGAALADLMSGKQAAVEFTFL